MKSTTALRFLQSVLIYLAALVIVGCDGSASMRIDVEVYNGPLAKTKEAQFAELEGSLEHAKRALKVVKDDLFISECRLGCRGDTAPECWEVEQEREKQKGNTPTKEIWFETYTEEKWKRVADKTPPQCLLKRLFCSKYEVEEVKRFKTSKEDKLIQVCPLIVDLKNDVEVLLEEFKKTCSKGPNSDWLKCAAKLGHRLRSAAEFWATKHIAIFPDSTRARIGLVEFTSMAAELGNEISARADALLKQQDSKDPIDRKQLPTSTYLQDSGATDYLNLVDWFKAAVDREGSDKLDRVRMIERLITDTHWSKINTVFAAGQGEVRMVFVKDDIGNWNLKSFSNDPTELLNAYKKIGSAALSTVAGLASKGGESISKMQDFMQFANNVALGSGSNSQELLSIESLHANTARRLNELIDRQKRKEESLKARIMKLEGNIPGLEQMHGAKETALREHVAARSELKRRREDQEGRLEMVRAEIAGLESRRGTEEATEENRGAINQQITLKQGEADQLATQIAGLQKAITDKDAEITKKEVELRHSSHDLLEKQEELAASRAEKKRLGADTHAEVRTILDGHEDILDVLQSSIVESSTNESQKPMGVVTPDPELEVEGVASQ